MNQPPTDQPALPTHHEVATECARLELGVDAAELHGALSGYLCGNGVLAREDWLARVLLDDTFAAPGEGSLDQLFQATRAQLAGPDFGFGLLLPEEEQGLEERTDALLEWCRGFLGGFGLVAGAAAALSEESREALEDLGRIAGSHLSCDDPDNDEAALAEVVEFVRVAAMLLYGDCVLAPSARARLH